HFNTLPDEDGVTRRVPIVTEFDGAYYESLSMAVVRLALGLPPVLPGFPAGKSWSKNYPGLEWIDLGPLRIPGGHFVTALVPYRGKQGSFKYVSATDVLHGNTPLDELKS